MSDATFFIDISTQLNDVYTGIGNVNHQLIKWFRHQLPAESAFFSGHQIIADEIIDEILQRRTGRGLGTLLDRGVIAREGLAASLARHEFRTTVGLFSTAKTMRRVFDYEAQIIHDLTVQLMPEYHRERTIEHHGTSIEGDLASNDLTICVSDNTRDDLELYLQVPSEKMLVAHLGVDDVQAVAPHGAVEPYFMVLGTIEPRKNVGLILSALNLQRDLLGRSKFVFVGDQGWGHEFRQLLSEYHLEDQLGSRILSLGYVSDEVRNTLLANARCCIYPSFYEGFGLPVIEALNAGCPVITSFSSSLPEVGGPLVTYIDPYEPAELVRALEEFVSAGNWSVLDPGYGERRAWASRFTWDKFCRSIFDRISLDLARQ